VYDLNTMGMPHDVCDSTDEQWRMHATGNPVDQDMPLPEQHWGSQRLRLRKHILAEMPHGMMRTHTLMYILQTPDATRMAHGFPACASCICSLGSSHLALLSATNNNDWAHMCNYPL
jgi:hypothetical protein